jgi:hypothetical protein
VAHNQAAFPQPLLGAINETPINTFDVNGSTLWNLPKQGSARTVQVRIDGDDGMNLANLQLFNLNPIRVPPFKTRQLEITILGNINVRSVHLATTMEELKAS